MASPSLSAMSVPHHTWYFRLSFDKVANNFEATFNAETSECVNFFTAEQDLPTS